MVEIFGKYYYLDIDGVTKLCKTGKKVKNDDGRDTFEINVLKYELVKLCIERLLNEYEPEDDGVGLFAVNQNSASFKFAFNTLEKNKIILEDEIDETDE